MNGLYENFVHVFWVGFWHGAYFGCAFSGLVALSCWFYRSLFANREQPKRLCPTCGLHRIESAWHLECKSFRAKRCGDI